MKDYYTLEVGEYTVTALRDASTVMRAELMEGADPALVKKYMPDGTLPSSVNAFVVRARSCRAHRYGIRRRRGERTTSREYEFRGDHP